MLGIILILALTSQTALASDPLNVSSIGAISVSGSFKDVVVEDGLAYCANWFGLAILDVSNPAEPTLISNVPTPGRTEGVAYQDGYCYVTDSHYGLWCYDVSDPHEPERAGLCELPSGSFGVTLDDNYAYVTNLGGSVKVVDISDPTSPEWISELETSSSWDVKILNGLAYVSNYFDHSLLTFDVEDPAHPSNVNQLEVEDRMYGIALTGNRIFTSIDEDLGLLGISLANAREPEIVARGSNPSQTLSAVGRYLYGWGDAGGYLKVHDISNEDTLIRVQRLFWAPLARVNEGHGRGSCYANGHLFGTGGVSGLRVYGFPRADNAAFVGEYADPQYPVSVIEEEGYLYIADMYGAIRTYSLENPSWPRLVDEQIFEAEGNEPNYTFYSIKVRDNLLFVSESGGHGGIQIFSLEDPAQPQHLFLIRNDVVDEVLNFDIADRYIYEAVVGYGIYVVDISDHDNPQIVHMNRRYRWGGGVANYGVAVFGDYLLSCHYYRGIATWSRNDDGTLTWLSELQLPDNRDAWRCVVYEDRGYIISRFPPTITVIDLSDPENLSIVAQYDDLINDGYHPNPKIVGDHLIVADGTWDGLKIFSLADPDRPQLVGRFDTPIDAWDVAVNGDYAYVADGHDVSVYDISEALQIDPPGFFTIQLARGWNLVSAPIVTDEEDVEILFHPLVENGLLNLVKDFNGRFFRPANGFNNIPRWDLHQGYQVNVSAVASLRLGGEGIELDEPIPLRQGWNMAAYFPTNEIDAQIAFAGLGDTLILAKDGVGRFYLPRFNFCNMGGLSRGNGYQVKVTENAELVWNLEDGRLAVNDESNIITSHFRPVHPTGTNMSLLVQLPIQMKAGELGAIGDDGTCAGAAVLTGEDQVGLAVWGDDPTTTEKEGIQVGQPIRLRWWDKYTETDISWSSVEGDSLFKENGLLVAKINSPPLAPKEFGFSSLSPNPFNSSIQISYYLPDIYEVRLVISDLQGREVGVFVNQKQALGPHTIVWNADGFPSGMYISRLMIKNQSQSAKVILIR